MDELSKELSMYVYYGFGCYEDTCPTVQMTRRTWQSIGVYCNNHAHIRSYRKKLGTGSLFEGTALQVIEDEGRMGSDIDQMIESRQFQVYPVGYNKDYDFTKYCLQMKKSEYTRPGYCLVEMVGQPLLDLDLHFEFEQLQLYENIARQLCKPGYFTGPAVSFVNSFFKYCLFRYDFVICFASRHWPSECRNWSDLIPWPSVTLQESVKREGFHIVKVGHLLSVESDKEWRMSFSVAEKMLIHSFNPTQLTCAVVMKLLLNHYIKPVVPDSINSYHIKTLMLWSVEQDTDQKWEPQYFIQCIEKLLTNLMQCISVGILQHYFILDCNLFEFTVTKDNKEMLLHKVEELQLSVVEKCIRLLRVIGMNIPPFEKCICEALCLKNIAFRSFCDYKTDTNYIMLCTISHLIKFIVATWIADHDINQHQYYLSLVQIIISVLSWNYPKSYKMKYERLWDKCLSYLKTWCSSIIFAICKSKVIEIRMKENYNEISWRNICEIGKYILTKSYENASTTGCIKMALVYMCEGNHYTAVPLLNRALNIIDQFDNYSLYKLDKEHNHFPDNVLKYNFTEYIHLYNDQEAIETALIDEFSNDRALCKILFIWLETNLLPPLVQLELTQTFYKVDILKLLNEGDPYNNPFQHWNPIPLTHFLLFVCHYELLKSVTFLDPVCLQDDMKSLQSLIHDQQRIRQDDVPSVLNLLAWCYLKMKENKFMIKHTVKTVQLSTTCDKTLFSHLFIQHVLGAVITQDIRCIVS